MRFSDKIRMPDLSPIERDAIGAQALSPDRLAPTDVGFAPAAVGLATAVTDFATAVTDVAAAVTYVAAAVTDPATAVIGQRIQEPYLNNLRKIRRTVVIYLINGVKLVGKIASFDQHTVALEGHEKQVINKHAIATVMPAPPRPAVRKPRDTTIVRRNHLGLPIKPQ